MLESVKINRRQSEIRQELASLVGKEQPTEDETRSMEALDTEYKTNETRYRASLVAEDEERSQAGKELETRSDTEWQEVINGFEVRQVALNIDEGKALDGATNEIVTELRSQGGYQGIPIPWQALEVREGETVSSGTPNPVSTRPIIERLFANSMASRMGGQMINIPVGEVEFPLTTSKVTAGWALGETGDVSKPQAYTTLDRPLKPDHNLGVQMKITRKTLKQSGGGLEQAIRRDMNGAIGEALDKAVFNGIGSGGEPTGLFTGAEDWGITETAIGAAASYAAFRAAVVRFMKANAAAGAGDVNLMLNPDVFDAMDDLLISGTAVSDWDRLISKIKNVHLSNHAITDATKAIMTTKVGGVAPFFIGTWGAVDLIRDPYTKAPSGSLMLTAITTADVTISRASQIEILTGIGGA